jgi:hypothetical protein
MKSIHIISGFLVLLLFSSCTGISQQDIDSMKEPATPYQRDSDYGQALDRFSAMLAAYDVPEEELVLLGKTVVNKTACANLPMDITQMVATAVNRIGGRVAYLPYNPKYLESELIIGLPVGREVPTLVIDGAITECDENMDHSELGVNADITATHNGQEGDAGGSYGKEINLSRIALDFHLMDYQTSRLVPRIQSSIAVDVRTMKGGYDFAIQVLGSGFGLNRSRKIAQGKHDAIRTLVDVSILQLLGQYLQVPYWRCLPGSSPDKLVVRTLKEQFFSVPEQAQVAATQALLLKHGYAAVEITGILDKATLQAIQDVAARSNHQAPARISPGLYSYLYVNMPINFAIPASIVSYGMGQQTAAIETATDSTGGSPDPDQPEETSRTAPAAEKPAVAAKSAPAPLSLSVQTAVIYRPGGKGQVVLVSGGSLQSGDYYKVVVEPEQDCYLYIFQLDSGGRLFTLFPGANGRGRVKNPVRGNVVYELPGKDDYYFLDRNKGNEKIIYYSTTRPDPLIEQNIFLLGTRLEEEKKLAVEKELIDYFAGKKVVWETDPGRGIALTGNNSSLQVRLNRIAKLNKNIVYVFPFMHQ